MLKQEQRQEHYADVDAKAGTEAETYKDAGSDIEATSRQKQKQKLKQTLIACAGHPPSGGSSDQRKHILPTDEDAVKFVAMSYAVVATFPEERETPHGSCVACGVGST